MAVGPVNIYPGVLSWLGVARELSYGTPLVPTATNGLTHPVEQNQFEPEDSPRFLRDNAIRGSMTDLFYETLGVESATFSFGGPNFLDSHGYFMDNIFGDLSTTGALGANPATVSTTPIAVGGTTMTLGAAPPAAYTAGAYIQIGTGNNAEVVAISSTAASNVVNFVNNPARFTHPTSFTVNTVSAPFTHRFFALNSQLGYNGFFGAQPPTHTMADVTNIVNTYTSATYGTVLSTGIGARLYASACLRNMDFSGNAEQLLNIRMAGDSNLSILSGTAVNTILSNARPIPNWTTTVNILGASITQIGEFNYSFTRNIQVYWTVQGSQTPYIIARGPLNVTGSLQWDPVINEQPLDMMLLNAQGGMTLTTSNSGLVTGGVANPQGFTIATQFNQVANIKSKIMRNKALIGFANNFEGVANTVDTGGSGGIGPGGIVLTNTVPTYNAINFDEMYDAGINAFSRMHLL